MQRIILYVNFTVTLKRKGWHLVETNIEQLADAQGLTVGTVLFLIVKYLVDDPHKIHPFIEEALTTATDQEIEEALETITEDLVTMREFEGEE